VFRKAAELLMTPEYSQDIEKNPYAAKEWYACHVISRHANGEVCKIVTDKYREIMVGFKECPSTGWFGPITIANRNRRVMSLLLSAEYCGNAKFTYED
jgi:hypothetical protein